jgi:hypothetical protein
MVWYTVVLVLTAMFLAAAPIHTVVVAGMLSYHPVLTQLGVQNSL